MKNNKKQLKIMSAFIIYVAIAELLIMAAVLGLYYFVSSFHWNFENVYLTSIAITIFIIFTITILIALKLEKRIFRPFMEIRDVTRKVIKGDFAARLPETSRILELNEVAADLNIMVTELGNIEMMKEDFIANVSHEFKTPLSVIEGYVTLLQGDISQEEKDEYINMILQNTEKLSTLTGNILAISKLENRSIPLQKEKIRIDKQICNIMVDFNEIWEEKKMDIDLQLDKVELYGYPALLSRVWSNLIQNAIKFSDLGGSLKITCKGDEKNAIITFSDRGCGMDEDVIRHIFDKFYQGDDSRSTQGNGLGLALVKQIIALSNGTISVDSKIGQGSTFIIELPQLSE